MRITLWVVALWLVATGAWAAELGGRVVGVTDGDTITVLAGGNVQEKIRLAGIDAPEVGQPFGQASKRNLSDQLHGRQVVVEWVKRDRYGRIVGKVLVNGNDACLGQIKSGLAWHYKKYEDEQSPAERTAYALAEDAAKAAKTGLWSEAAAVPPWEWRKLK